MMIAMIHPVYLMSKGQLMAVVFVLHMERELELETVVLVAVVVECLLSAKVNYQILLL